MIKKQRNNGEKSGKPGEILKIRKNGPLIGGHSLKRIEIQIRSNESSEASNSKRIDVVLEPLGGSVG